MQRNPSIRHLSHFAHKGLAALCVATLLVGCGGGGSSGPGDNGGGGTSNGLAVSQPGELTAFVQERLRRLNANGQLGTSGGGGGDLVPTGAGPVAAAGTSTTHSTTLVQEDGVDEADLLRTDGSHLYAVQSGSGSGPVLSVHARSADGQANLLTTLMLPVDGSQSADTNGMVITEDQRVLAVISRSWTAVPAVDACPNICATLVPYWTRSNVEVHRVDISNPAAATAGERIEIDGTLVDSRRIGDALYIVSTFRPALAAQWLPATATAADREAAITALNANELLPRMRRNGGPSEALLSETDCYVQNANGSTDVQFTTVTVFDLRSSTLAHTSRCFLGGTEAMYMSAGNLYLATTRWSVPVNSVALVYPSEIRTDIHKFALTGGTVAYRGSGDVAGHIGWDRQRSSFRFSEYNGDLRVLTFTGTFGWLTLADASSTAPSPATLTVLRERSSDHTLQPVATLPNSTRPATLGKPGEQVYGVRFLGDRAYVVTFRRTDPLYVLDLSNPVDPKTVGQLELAGFSDDLFPLPGGRLLGMGRDADSNGRATGLKAAVFDVSDAGHPALLSSISLGTTGSYSALDSSRHGLNLMQVGATTRLAFAVALTSVPYDQYRHGLQKLEVDGAGTLRNAGLVGRNTSTFGPLWQERSVQIGDQLYYLGNGALDTFSW